MFKLKLLATLSASALLGACAATTPTAPTIPAGAIGNATANADGTYTVTANSTTYDLGAPTAFALGDTLRFYGFTPFSRARGFSNADVTAFGGILADGTAFSGISGTAAASVPTTGMATYSARFTLVYPTTSGSPVIGGLDGAQTISVDFAAGSVNSSGALSLVGTISGVTFSGTATCSYGTDGCSSTVPMEGGFYGTDGIAAAFAGTGLAGAVNGTKNP